MEDRSCQGVRPTACLTLAVVLGLLVPRSGTADQPGGPTRLGIKGTGFTLNDRPAFLLGVSYYGALGASEETIRQDLDDMRRRGFNWIRVWATWGAFDNDVSAVDAEGNAAEAVLEPAPATGRGVRPPRDGRRRDPLAWQRRDRPAATPNAGSPPARRGVDRDGPEAAGQLVSRPVQRAEHPRPPLHGLCGSPRASRSGPTVSIPSGWSRPPTPAIFPARNWASTCERWRWIS